MNREAGELDDTLARLLPGMGGAMDPGDRKPKRVIAAMSHTGKKANPKY